VGHKTLIDVEKILGSVPARLINGDEVLVKDQKILVKRVGEDYLAKK
jgi:hypothetical protein